MTLHAERDDTGTGLLRLEGALTIGEVSKVKQQLVTAIEQNNNLAVDVTQLSAVDVAGVQLLCAGHRFAARHACRLFLQVGDNQLFRETVRSLGLERSLACDAAHQDGCLWSAPSAGKTV